MKRSEKTALSAIALALVLGVAFAALYGVTLQRRNAARANLPLPESMAMYDAMNAAGPETDAPSEAPAPPRDELSRLRAQVQSFDELFKQTAFTHNDPEWGELLKWIGQPESEWPEDGWEQLRRFVTMIQPFLERIRALAARGGPVYPLDFSKGYAMELPHLAPMRNLARLLRAEALVAAEQGDTARVVDNIVAMVQLGEALKDEPVLISQLVRIAITGIAYDTMRELPPDGLDPAHYDRLVTLLAQADHRDAFASSFAGEAIISEANFERPSRDMFDYGIPDNLVEGGLMWLYTSPVGRPLMMMDEADLMDILARIEAASALPLYESQPLLDEVQQTIANLPFTRIISRTTLPAVTRANQAQARHEAVLDIAQLGLAVEAFRAQYGAYPLSLDELADRIPGGIPVDPHTGQPYIYRPSGDTFLLYKVLPAAGFGGDIFWRGVQDLTP
jgi:hypothetical protein